MTSAEPFVKLSFHYYDDIVISSLDDAAEVMFTRGLAYCGRTHSNGFIPHNKLPELSRRKKIDAVTRIAESLSSHVNGYPGPFQRVPGGYRIRNYSHYQSQLEAIQQRRQNDRERKARERAARADGHGSNTTSVEHKTDEDDDEMSRDSHVTVTHPSKSKSKSKRELLRNSLSADAQSEEEHDDLFDEFWALYPRKIGKGHARKAFVKALAKTDHETICLAASYFAAWCEDEGTAERFIPHPTTWLNAERWNDERQLHTERTRVGEHLALVKQLAENETMRSVQR